VPGDIHRMAVVGTLSSATRRECSSSTVAQNTLASRYWMHNTVHQAKSGGIAMTLIERNVRQPGESDEVL
jgi:chaperone required for assembly of F1-ATPase